MEFSKATVQKARDARRRGLVDQDAEHPGVWWVTSLRDDTQRYRVQVSEEPSGDYDTISWITCTCPHGLNVGYGQTHCYHAAAVLIAMQEHDKREMDNQ